MKKYKEFTISAHPFNADVLSGRLWELDITGLNEEDDKLIVYANSNSEINEKIISVVMEELKKEKLIESFSVTGKLLEDKNWNEEWEKSVEVMRISNKIVIKPSFKNYEKTEGEIVIIIDPKMSFGTGCHQTTKLVLKFLEKYVKSGQIILDVGAGTGILAIASVFLGAKKVLAVDNDEWCYDNCMENCTLNNVSNKVEIMLGEIYDVKQKNFDLITANIQKNVLLQIAQELFDRLNAGGYLILSGLLVSDEMDITEKYESLSLKKTEKAQLDEWISIVFRKQ